MHVGELRPGPGRLDPGLLRRVHRVVDHSLVVAEPSVDRQGPGDVGGVERVQLDPGVEQQQVAVAHVAVVADPVQGAGVLARGRDGVVADGVAHVPGVQAEDPLDPALAAAAADRLRQLRHHGRERLDRLPAGLPQLLDLELVLGQPQLAERLGQLGVGGELTLLARRLGRRGPRRRPRSPPARGRPAAPAAGWCRRPCAGGRAGRRCRRTRCRRARPSPPATAGRRPTARRSGRRRRTPRSPGGPGAGSTGWRRGRCRWVRAPGRRPAPGRCPAR